MKKEILLKPEKASLSLFLKLEKKKLIRLIRPLKKTIETRTKTGAVERFYTSRSKNGSHTFMSVGKRTEDIKLSFHDDNEEFLLINPLNLKFKKLYLVISYLKKKDFFKKAENNALSAKDFAAIELEFNNPALSFFIMLKDTVHCETTDNSGGQHPVFFVTEASRLKDNKIRMKNFDIRLGFSKNPKVYNCREF
ncbi:MAG: hypothetical protein LBL00_07405 [Endomicrobium sp.]|jgi:hypothetical protein|nr:hypothetical protein [Endomicrobium sp.]